MHKALTFKVNRDKLCNLSLAILAFDESVPLDVRARYFQLSTMQTVSVSFIYVQHPEPAMDMICYR